MQQWIKNSFECKHKEIKLNSVSVAFNSNFKNIKFFLKLKQTIKNEEKKKVYSLLPTECRKEENLWRKSSLLQDNPHWHWFKKLFRPVHCYSVHLLYVLQIEFVSKKWKLCQLALYLV